MKTKDEKMLSEAYQTIYKEQREGAGLEGFADNLGEQPTAQEMEQTPEIDQYTYPMAQFKKDYMQAQRDVVDDTFGEIQEATLEQLDNPEVIQALHNLASAVSAGMVLPPMESMEPGQYIRELGYMMMNTELQRALEQDIEFELLLTDEDGRVIEKIPSSAILF
jgi:hypothetical protein